MAGTLTIHYGYPGSGKTLFAMNDVILPAVKENRPFFTNITGISLSALSALTGVHPAMIKYYEVKDINDIIRYFNDDKICHDGIFVLDEMKDFIDDKKAIDWLEHCINYMRKQTVDFVMIAQQDAKEYIHPNIVNLAHDSFVFVPRKAQKDNDHVDKWYIRGGHPRIIDMEPANAVGHEILAKPYKMYSCYKTSENAFYQGQENDSFRGLVWYKTRKWKFRFIIIGLFVLAFIVLVFMISGITGLKESPNNLNKVTKEVASEKAKNYRRVNLGESSPLDSIKCFKYIYCDSLDCTTDFGVYPSPYYNSNSGLLCGVGGRCLSKCERTYEVPNGGGLLSVGKQVFSH